MLDLNNPDLTRHMIDDHRARLQASKQGQLRHNSPRQPGRLRFSCGQMLIQIGERLRGAQVPTTESRPVHLALAD